MRKMRTTWPMSIYLLYWMDRLPSLGGNSSRARNHVHTVHYVYAYLFFKEKGSIHIVQSARCLFILFVFYNLYIYIVRLSSTMIHCVTTHFPFLLLSLLPSFFIMKNYICPKKNSVIYLSFYCVSISPLQAVNCIPWAVKICFVSVKSLSQMFMSHIRKCMFRLCVYLLGIYQSFYVQTCFWFVYNCNDWPKGFSQWFCIVKHSSDEMEKKKRAIWFSFLIKKMFFFVFSPLDVLPCRSNSFRQNFIAFIMSHHI